MSDLSCAFQKKSVILKILSGISIVFISLIVWAGEESPQTFSLSGTLYQTGTSIPLNDPNTKILVQILNPDKTCLLYEEQQVINVSSTGFFNIQVGSARSATKRTASDPRHTMSTIFQNAGMIFGNSLPGTNCIGGLYIPNPGDTRYIRLTVTPSATNVPDRLVPDIAMNSTPSALVAQSVQGLERNKILQIKESATIALTQNNLEWLLSTINYSKLQTLMAGGLIAGTNNGASLPSISNNPSSPTEGAIWYDSVAKVIKYSNGTSSIPVGSAGGAGVSSITVGSNLTADGVAGGTLSASGTIDLKNSGVTAGTYSKMTVNTKGLVTASSTLDEADIPTLSTAGKVSASAINTGTMGGNAIINTTGNLTTTGTVTANNISTNAVYSTAINGGSTASANLTLDSTSHSTKGNIVLVPSGGNVGIGTPSPGSALDVKGEIRMSGATSGYNGFKAAATAGSTIWTLPTADGSNGHVLTTNGSGVLSWVAPAVTGITSLNGQTDATQTFATPGTTGTAPNWSSATNAHTLHIPMAATASVTAGLISKTEYDSFNGKLSPTLTSSQIFVGNGSNVATGVAMSGDAAIDNTGAVSVNKIKGTAVSATVPTASGHVLRFDGTSTYIPAFLSLADIRSTVTPGNTMFPASTCTAAQTMTWSSLTDTMTCSNIAISNTAVSGLGTAATLNVGTGNNNIVQLDGSSKLPAVDGSQLTNVVAAWSSITSKPTTISGYGITNAITNVAGTPSIESDVIASRPAFGTAGRLYLSTDTKMLYRDTGSAWEAIGDGAAGGVTSVATGTGLTGGPVTSTGTISLADTAVTAASYGNSTSVATFTVDAQGRLTAAATTAIPTSDTNTKGLLTAADWTTFNNKLGTGTSFSGDVSGAYNSTSVDKIKGTAVSATVPTASGHVLRFDGTSTYIPAFLSLADIRSTVTPGNTMFPASTCTAAQTMTWSSLTDTMTCSNIALAASAITSGTVAVANGGTGTATGSITGTGALTFTAGGTNENVTLTPSGTGVTFLNSKVGINSTSLSTAAKLEVANAATSTMLASFNYGTYSVIDFNTDGAGNGHQNIRDYQGTVNIKLSGQGGSPPAVASVKIFPSISGGGTNTYKGISIEPTIAQSASASYTALLINPTETSTGSGTNSLILGQIGGATKFSVSNTGAGYFAGNVGIGTSSPNSKLEIASGSLTTAFSDVSAATVDFSTANVIRTSVTAGTLTLSNMRDGTSYTLILSGTGTYTLSGSSVTTWRCSPACPSGQVNNSSGHALIDILKAGTTAYVRYIVDMQ